MKIKNNLVIYMMLTLTVLLGAKAVQAETLPAIHVPTVVTGLEDLSTYENHTVNIPKKEAETGYFMTPLDYFWYR